MSSLEVWLDFGFNKALCLGLSCGTPTQTLRGLPVILLLCVICIVSLGHGWDQLRVTNQRDPFWKTAPRPWLLTGDSEASSLEGITAFMHKHASHIPVSLEETGEKLLV